MTEKRIGGEAGGSSALPSMTDVGTSVPKYRYRRYSIQQLELLCGEPMSEEDKIKLADWFNKALKHSMRRLTE